MNQEIGLVEAKRWLFQAQEDILSAEANLREERFYMVALCAHQASEKALKALIIKTNGKMAPKIHDLRKLGELVRVPSDLIAILEMLAPAYMTSRYPDALEGEIPAEAFRADDATRLLDAAKQVVLWATNQI